MERQGPIKVLTKSIFVSLALSVLVHYPSPFMQMEWSGFLNFLFFNLITYGLCGGIGVFLLAYYYQTARTRKVSFWAVVVLALIYSGYFYGFVIDPSSINLMLAKALISPIVILIFLQRTKS